MSISRLGVDIFPDIDIPYVSITTVLEDASPETIETEVTDVIEEHVNTISGIELLRSTSTEGLSQVFIEFALGEDLDVKAQDVRDKIGLARQDLPREADLPIVEKVDPDAAPVMSILVSGDMSIGELTHFADGTVKENIQRLGGVGSVTVVGGREREVRIWLDLGRLRSYKVTADEVIRAIQQEHADIPGGRIESDGNRREYGFKTKGEVKSVREFEDIVVAFRENGAPTRVRDVARVEDGLEDDRTYAELNGKTGISLDVRRQSGTNTVEVARTIREAVADLRKLAPIGVEMIIAKDMSSYIQSSVDAVGEDMLIAVILVAIVTLLFLLSLRATLIVSIAMPTALISTFFCFYVAGFTINMMTLMALSMAVGLLVDDAIVVLECIQRHIDEGRPPMEAASTAIKEVGPAVVAATLAVMAVYVPIAFMTGVVGQFFFEYGLTVVFSIGVSLLVSLTLTPTLCARTLKKVETHGVIFTWIEGAYEKVEYLYGRLLKIAVRWRGLVLISAMGMVVVGVLVARNLEIDFMSSTDRSEFTAGVELPMGTGLQESKEIAGRLAELIRTVPYVKDVFFTIGGGSQAAVNVVSFYARLVSKEERPVHQHAVQAEVRKVLTSAAPQANRIDVSEISIVSGGGISSFIIEFSVSGPDLAVLEEKVEAISTQMNETGLFADVQTSYQPGKPEIQVAIDRLKAADMSVSVQALANTARILAGGADVTTYEEDGKRYDVRARLKEDQRSDLASLGLIQVRGADGTLIDLDSVADIRVATGPAQIDRQSRTRKIAINANVNEGVALGTATFELDGIVDGVGFEIGYKGEHLGTTRRMKKTVASVIGAFGIALISLYMILASQFNSFSQPLVVMLTAPLSFVGAFTALLIADQTLSIFVQIGIIALMGLVMKNGILFVDLANQLRASGHSAIDAIQEAGPVRLRPILMTAFSTIFGMVPVALAVSQGSEMRSPLGYLVIGGMTSSTFLTLLVVPAAYVALDDVMRFSRRTTKTIAERLSKSVPTEQSPAE
jgi:HAE1 family hydrophobic/amphiphilic exporter-1